ncbi:hypothetical protein ADIS_3944 [Lunatimonas lonarensis]|uniref:Uncharacterized protein n=1 Tax=Lunatimonas lonarensis TaxID=1232681 RepID=R7ZN61_9BACT|nr:hypothetical protein ADIS_3944 [Lunatimonas lonarensis]
MKYFSLFVVIVGYKGGLANPVSFGSHPDREVDRPQTGIHLPLNMPT